MSRRSRASTRGKLGVAGGSRPGRSSGRQELLAAAARHQAAGAFDEAGRCLRQALQLDPEHADTLHALALLRRRGGHMEEAEALLRRAIRARPRVPSYHNNLAGMLIEQRRPGEAIEAYRAALALEPDHVNALFNLASVLKQQGRFAEALDSLRRLAELLPEDSQVWCDLGEVLLRVERPHEAARAFERCLRITPEHAVVLCNLSILEVFAGRSEQALRHARRALDVAPDSARAHNALGTALLADGDLEQARLAFERAIALDESLGAAWLNLAGLLDWSEQTEQRVAQAESVLARDSLQAEQRERLHFALGKMHEDRADYRRAFTHFGEGNRLHRRQLSFDRRAFADSVDRRIERFSTAFIGARRGQGDASPRPVFIVGMPRSGTTLVEQILASHPRVHGGGELHLVPDLVAGLDRKLAQAGGYPEALDAIESIHLATLSRAYLEKLAQGAGDCARVTDKLPGNFLELGLISLLFPGARVIHCRRDPRDLCVSNFVQRFMVAQHFSYDLQDLGFFHHHYQRMMAHWRSVTPLPLLEVDYEALVSEPERWSRALVEFLELDWDPCCLRFYQSKRSVFTASYTQVRKPIYRSSVARWRRYEGLLGELEKGLRGEEA